MRHRSGTSDRIWALPIVVGIAAVAAFMYFMQREPARPTANAEPARVEPLAESAPVSPPVDARVPETRAPEREPEADPQPAIPLPALDESDEELRGALIERFGADAVDLFMRPEQFVRNVVVTLDNLPREKAALEQRPIQSTPGSFAAAGTEDEPVMAERNYARYAPFIAVLEAADAAALATMYRRYEPLLQQAYEELGYPEGDFNARLVEVVDHLLAAPEVPGPIRLERPNVLYEFADEALEARSAGHKLLIRMGPEHADVVKRKLREIRGELTR